MGPLRKEIDLIDDELIKLLEKRFLITSKVGDVKRENIHAVLDTSREQQILEKIKSKDPIIKDELEAVYKAILTESKKGISLKQHPECPFNRIKIIGVGLIGGSISKNLAGHIGEDDPDLIIISTPIDSIIPIAKEIKSNKPLVVIDVGSIKREIVAAFESLNTSNVDFIGTHPLAGKVVSGFENSSPTLFVNASWVITPHSKNKAENISKVSAFIEFLGAAPAIMNAEEHDKKAAYISHLPAILARKYYQFVETENKEALDIAGPGFKSFTRLAHDNPELRAAIEKKNADNIEVLGKKWSELMQKELG